MGRAINIGELLQSGLLGGAQLYNQQASRNQQREIATRELDQRQIAMNDRAVQAEFEREQARQQAQRMLDQEAADGTVFKALYAEPGNAAMGPFQPGMEPPDPLDTIDINTMVRASPRAQDLYARAKGNKDAWRKERDYQQWRYQQLKGMDLAKNVTLAEAQKMLDAGVQFDEDHTPFVLRDQTAAGQAAIRDAHINVLSEFSPEELAGFASMRPDVFNRDFAKALQAENVKRREGRMEREEREAEMAEDMVDAQRFAAANGTTLDDAVFLGREGRKQVIFDKVRTRPDTITDDEMRILTESATKRLDRARDAYMKVNIDEAGEPLGFMAPTKEEEARASQPPDPPGLGNSMDAAEHQRLRARVAAFDELRTAIAEEKAARAAAMTLSERRKQGSTAQRVPRAPLPFGGAGSDFAPTGAPAGQAAPADQSIREMISRGASDEEIEAAMNRGVQ